MCVLEGVLEIVQGRQYCFYYLFLFVCNRVGNLFGHSLLEVLIVGGNPLKLFKKFVFFLNQVFDLLAKLLQLVFLWCRLSLLF
ncbi:hypothetical protein ES703_100316 [subsurface metagenome]